ncbi:MAG: carbohydrate kinase family protein [Candidatus Beckwithbacteria bacterium]|nr:carbohydrate kinase family protein [Candidatus Beckwithbacteria bacterium]
MKFDVVTFGSSFVDVYLTAKDFKVSGGKLAMEYGGKLAVDKMVMTTGGGATNTAAGFERLGLQTACVTCLGKDHWGLFIRKELKKEGVSQLYIQQVNEPTSYSTILVGEDGGRTVLVYRGASNYLSWQKVEWEHLNPDWFYVSSLGGEFNLLTKIVRAGQEKRIKVALNPGMSEINSPERLKQFLPHVEVLILNLEEAAKLTQHEPDNKTEILKDVVKLGARLVAVTEGRKGATLLEGKKKVVLEAVKARVVQESGAGDAFGCGLVTGLIKFTSLEKALKLGLANGASVVEHFGPKEGLLFEPEVEEWLKK